MAFQTVKSHFYWPKPPVGYTSAPSLFAQAIDAADEGIGYLIDPPKTGNLRKIHWLTGTTTTGATVDVRVETLTRAGAQSLPSGTLFGTDTNGAHVVLSTDDNVVLATTLTADAAVTKGTPIAIVIKQPTASFGNMNIQMYADDMSRRWPVALRQLAVSPAVSWEVLSGQKPWIALEYDDGAIYPSIGVPFGSAITASSPSSSTTPDTVGQRFQIPFKARIRGFWVWWDHNSDTTVRLVSSAYHQANATGILLSRTVNTQDSVDNSVGFDEWEFSNSYEAAINTNYRLVFEPGATAIDLYYVTSPTLALLDGMVGQNIHMSTAKDPTGDGDWTNYNSGTFRTLFCGLILDGFGDDAGDGGARGNLTRCPMIG